MAGDETSQEKRRFSMQIADEKFAACPLVTLLAEHLQNTTISI
jgi:hypothetical protein